jgi:hypothetical protein
MNLSRDSILALQRHFLGALSGPARTWLEPLPSSPLVFVGDAIRTEHGEPLLDFGCVASPGEEHRLLRVCNRGSEDLEVRMHEPPPWLSAGWLESDGDRVLLRSGHPGATAELIVPHDAEREFRGALRFEVGNEVFELSVSMSARRFHPHAELDFNGSPQPTPFDFGCHDRPYRLSIANATSVPLVVTFSDLPHWLEFEVDGRPRGGPIDGPFFERTAPFSVTLRPRHLGRQAGTLRLCTNDPRPEMREIDLQLTSSLIAERRRIDVHPQPLSARRRGILRPETLIGILGFLFLLLLLVLARGLS